MLASSCEFMIKQALSPELLQDKIESGNRNELRNILNDEEPFDVAKALSELDEENRNICFRLLDIENAGFVISELEPQLQTQILNNVNDILLVPIISKMSSDDAVDLLHAMPEDKVKKIISQMTDTESQQTIQELIKFENNSAGGIMLKPQLKISQNITVKEALNIIKSSDKFMDEEIYDIFITDESSKLVGWVNLKELLRAPEIIKISDIMSSEVICVTTDVHQQEVAKIMRSYDIITLPVVDKDNVLKGIITADDVFDVIEEEATQDILQAQGISPIKGESEKVLKQSVRKAFKARLPWLLITAVIETASATIINDFDGLIKQFVVAASFMPLLSGVTGSVATQSTCIVIRGIEISEISFKNSFKNIFHELKVGMLLGISCGIFATTISYLLNCNQHYLGLIVGFSLFTTMSVGVLIGTTMPLVFGKLGIDPAHASGPFITSILDVCTFTIYLSIVSNTLRFLR